MVETDTPDAETENPPDGGENKAERPTPPKAPDKPKAPWYAPEAKGGDGATNQIAHTQRAKTDTLFQTTRDMTEGPTRTATKLGLFALNPVVYSTIYGADWLAQRTPGVNMLYQKPREAVRSTANRVFETLHGTAVAIPTAPIAIAEEMGDKAFRGDITIPTSGIGRVLDKICDVAGAGFNVVSSVIGKTAEIVQRVGGAALNVGGNAASGLGSGVGTLLSKPWEIAGRLPFPVNYIGQIGLFALYASLGHAAIGGTLSVVSPAMHAVYNGAVQSLLQGLGSLSPI